MSVNTKTSLDTMFKNVVASDVNSLIPDNVELLRSTKLAESEKIGRKYLQPVALTLENGVTYGDDTAFALNDPLAGVYDEIEFDSKPVVLRSQVSQDAADRMVLTPKAFATWATLRAQVMMKSISRRAETAMWYGQQGIGTISGNPSVDTAPAPDQADIILTAASWAPGIWSGMEGAQLDCYDGSSKINANGALTIVSIDYDARTLTVSGDNTDLTDLADGYKLFFKGSKTNDMVGVDGILSNTGALFGIDAAVYSQWAASAHSAASGELSMSKVLKAVAKAVGKGGLDEEVNCYISTRTYEDLNGQFSALRSFDSSFNKSKGTNGVERVEYFGQNGKITVIPCAFVKEGEGFIIPPKQICRVGATDITFGTKGPKDEEFFMPIPGYAGYELRCHYNFGVLIRKPATCVKITSIVNS